jgi:hypothetical protein
MNRKAVLFLLFLLFTITFLSAVGGEPGTVGSVTVRWTSDDEIDLLGFNVLRADVNDANTAIQINRIICIIDPMHHSYAGVDNTVIIGRTYYYWIQYVHFDGTSALRDFQVLTAYPPPPPPPPDRTLLGNVYPNPIHMNYDSYIPLDVKGGEIASITIYNIRGQVVRSFKRGEGRYNILWDLRDDYGKLCGTGTYFYQMTTKEKKATKKLLIIK